MSTSSPIKSTVRKRLVDISDIRKAKNKSKGKSQKANGKSRKNERTSQKANRKRQMAKVERTKEQVKRQMAKGKAAADIPFLSPKAKPLSFRAQRGIPPWILVKQRTRARFLAALGMTPYGDDPRESALGFDFCDLRFAF
jgi:hypothetical protein